MKLNYITYRRALKRLFNTEDGKLVLAYWDLNKVKTSAFSTDAITMAGKLSIKEFIQGILHDVKDPREIEEIQQQSLNYEE